MLHEPRGRTLLALFAALAALAAACESPQEQDARKRRERSERELAGLLQTRACAHCQIYEAKLAGRDLRGIKLTHSVLDGDLRRADLRGAQLAQSSLGGDLRELDLRGAELEELELNPGSGQLAAARLDELDLRGMRFPQQTDWRGAVLAGANLAGLQFGTWGGPRRRMELPRGCLQGADLRRADLRGAWLSLTDLREADLRGANLRDAHLPPLDNLAGAKLEGAIAPNGETCDAPSLGRCVTGKHAQPPWR